MSIRYATHYKYKLKLNETRGYVTHACFRQTLIYTKTDIGKTTFQLINSLQDLRRQL